MTNDDDEWTFLFSFLTDRRTDGWTGDGVWMAALALA
jgi:hypothetical protein